MEGRLAGRHAVRQDDVSLGQDEAINLPGCLGLPAWLTVYSHVSCQIKGNF